MVLSDTFSLLWYGDFTFVLLDVTFLFLFGKNSNEGLLMNLTTFLKALLAYGHHKHNSFKIKCP